MCGPVDVYSCRGGLVAEVGGLPAPLSGWVAVGLWSVRHSGHPPWSVWISYRWRGSRASTRTFLRAGPPASSGVLRSTCAGRVRWGLCAWWSGTLRRSTGGPRPCRLRFWFTHLWGQSRRASTRRSGRNARGIDLARIARLSRCVVLGSGCGLLPRSAVCRVAGWASGGEVPWGGLASGFRGAQMPRMALFGSGFQTLKCVAKVRRPPQVAAQDVRVWNPGSRGLPLSSLVRPITPRGFSDLAEAVRRPSRVQRAPTPCIQPASVRAFRSSASRLGRRAHRPTHGCPSRTSQDRSVPRHPPLAREHRHIFRPQTSAVPAP